MAALVQVTSVKQAEPIASPASVQIDFKVLGILPDLVQVFASGLSGDIGILKDEVEMNPPEISYTSPIQLAGGSFFSISLCPRTATNGVLDEKIDDQPWETFCTFATITTQAPGTGGDKPAPVITTAEPHPATIKQQNGIKISWRSVHYELFNVRFAEQGNPEEQVEIDSPGTDGFFVLQPTRPKHTYIFKVQGCHSGLLGSSTCSPFAQVTVTAAQNTHSLRTFLSGVNASNGIRSLAPGIFRVRSLMAI